MGCATSGDVGPGQWELAALAIKHGSQQREGLEVADKAMEAWARVLTELGLIYGRGTWSGDLGAIVRC